jgi:subtilisin family serine protease
MNNYLVDFIDSATTEQITSYFSENNCSLVKEFSNLNKVYLVQSESEPPKVDLVESVIIDNTSTAVQLLSAIDVVPITASGQTEFSVEAEENWWKIYSLKELDFSSPSATVPIFGSNVNVYLVDSGIKADHPDFEGRDITLLHSLSESFDDTKGHGTALASLIVGKTCGLTSSTLKIVKIFEEGKDTLQSDLLAAFDAIINDVRTSSNKFSVVNLSWTIPKNPYIENKIKFLVYEGIAVVAAAGNNGVPIENVTPASMNEVFTIGAYNSDFSPCDFSNYTDPSIISLTENYTNSGEISAWAPGQKIYCASLDGSYGYAAGTSLAAAIYSASMAYNKSKYLNSSNDILSFFRAPDGTYIWVEEENRTGILDLSDPKYSASSNMVCTYDNTYETQMPVNSTSPLRRPAKTGDTRFTPLFARNVTASYELLDPLPPGATIECEYAVYSPKEEPSDPGGVDVHRVHFKITQSDGLEFENYIDFVHMSSTFDASVLPPDDPRIALTFVTGCISISGTPGKTCLQGTQCIAPAPKCRSVTPGKPAVCRCS